MKQRLVIAGLVILWVLCGVVETGGWTAHFQVKYHESSVRSDLSESLFPALMGPIGLFAIATQTGFYESGFCWTKRGCAALRSTE